VDGLIDYAERACGGVDPVIAAAVVSFGFWYVRPLVRANGHLHRWLVHHTLGAADYTPPGFVLPMSTATVRRHDEYRAVVKRELLRGFGETADAYRFLDMTNCAEFLYACLEDAIENDLRTVAAVAAI
jgi:hypothetical protein